MPDFTGKLDHCTRHFKQAHDFRSNQATVQLTNRVDPTSKQANARKIGQNMSALINEKTPMAILNGGLKVEPFLIYYLCHSFALTAEYSGSLNTFI